MVALWKILTDKREKEVVRMTTDIGRKAGAGRNGTPAVFFPRLPRAASPASISR